jgi:hypothetical protein
LAAGSGFGVTSVTGAGLADRELLLRLPQLCPPAATALQSSKAL